MISCLAVSKRMFTRRLHRRKPKPSYTVQCTLLSLENSLHFETRFENSKHCSKFRNISFEISLEHSHTISKFRKCQDNSAFENSSKVRRYFVSLKKSLVFVEKWRNVSKFVEIRSHYFCTVLYHELRMCERGSRVRKRLADVFKDDLRNSKWCLRVEVPAVAVDEKILAIRGPLKVLRKGRESGKKRIKEYP